jgi:transcriptional regulator with XRE-family HTH domain
MSKRNNIVIQTQESKALKAFRIRAGVSLRKLSELMDLSKTRIHQMEIGRDEISEDYIEHFLLGLGLSISDWKLEVGEKDNFFKLREECHSLLNGIDKDKLGLVFGLLSNL